MVRVREETERIAGCLLLGLATVCVNGQDEDAKLPFNILIANSGYHPLTEEPVGPLDGI